MILLDHIVTGLILINGTPIIIDNELIKSP